MIRHIRVASCVVVLLAVPGVSLAQSDTSTYSDTLRKHKAAPSVHKARQGTASGLHLKSAKKAVAKRSRGAKA
ncbi:MAG: hypothetical protein JWM91_3610 [Rhodospirillales bacterium]|nr:hypothetical protein [Rhodospirillales bacterium]